MRSPIPTVDHGHPRIQVRFPYKTEPQDMIAAMDSLNIEFVAATASLGCWNDARSGNEQADQVLRQHGRRFRGYVTVNPHVPGEAMAEVEPWRHFHTPPLIKLRPSVQQYAVNGPKYLPVWDYANQTGAVVLVHTWESHPHCGPLLFPKLARAHAKASIVLGHSGVTWRGYEQALEAAASTSNLYLERPDRSATVPCWSAAFNASVPSELYLLPTCRPSRRPPRLRMCSRVRSQTPKKEAISRHNFLRLLGEG